MDVAIRQFKAITVCIATSVVLVACSEDVLTPDSMPVATLEIMPQAPVLETGATIQLTPIPRDKDGNILNVNDRIVWSSMAENVATVAVDGMVTARSEGMATIRAFVDEVAASVSVRVVASQPEDRCGPFADWQSVPYVLPWPVGESHALGQSNCSGFGHSGFWAYGYDFLFPIGTVVTASRDGTVGWANDGCSDGDSRCTNLITVIHDDGTVMLYSHLTLNGVLVETGQKVAAGDTLGRSGNTGNTGGFPHLHLSLHPCNELPGLPGATDCPSMPLTFRNAMPDPGVDGLESRRFYTAKAH